MTGLLVAPNNEMTINKGMRYTSAIYSLEIWLAYSFVTNKAKSHYTLVLLAYTYTILMFTLN